MVLYELNLYNLLLSSDNTIPDALFKLIHFFLFYQSSQL